jgi:hypothetical protein
MTSSDCLSSNNHHPRLSIISRLNLPVPSIHNVNDELNKTLSTTTTPTSTSPSNFHTPTSVIQPRFPHPNAFAFPRPPPPPSHATLLRKSIEFKPPEQDILDKNFFHTFNMEQKEEKINKNLDTTINKGNIYKEIIY